MSDAWRVELTPAARRDLRRLDPQVRRRVIKALDGLSTQPPRGDIRRLAGVEAEWRLRVGDWRVRFTREQTTHTVYVLRVLPAAAPTATEPESAARRRRSITSRRNRGRIRDRWRMDAAGLPVSLEDYDPSSAVAEETDAGLRELDPSTGGIVGLEFWEASPGSSATIPAVVSEPSPLSSSCRFAARRAAEGQCRFPVADRARSRVRREDVGDGSAAESGGAHGLDGQRCCEEPLARA